MRKGPQRSRQGFYLICAETSHLCAAAPREPYSTAWVPGEQTAFGRGSEYLREEPVALLDPRDAESFGVHVGDPATDVQAVNPVKRVRAEARQDTGPKKALIAGLCLRLEVDGEAKPLGRPGVEGQGGRASGAHGRVVHHVGFGTNGTTPSPPQKQFTTPQSHPTWWGNDHTHVQSAAWLSAGYRVDAIDLAKGRVRYSTWQGRDALLGVELVRHRRGAFA